MLLYKTLTIGLILTGAILSGIALTFGDAGTDPEPFDPEEETPLESSHNELPSDCFRRLEIANITASGHTEDYIPHNMVDNSFVSLWRQQGNNSWISIHLNGQNNICRINIAWDNQNLRPIPISFVISVSENGDTFENIGQHISWASKPLFERYGIQDSGSTASYIKIEFNDNNSSVGIREINIYGR
jgi:hypothetical protein